MLLADRPEPGLALYLVLVLVALRAELARRGSGLGTPADESEPLLVRLA